MSTRTDTLFPYTTRFRADLVLGRRRIVPQHAVERRAGAHLQQPGHRQLVTQQRLRRHQDQRLAELAVHLPAQDVERSEEHTSELQSLMRISYAVFCLKKKQH